MDTRKQSLSRRDFIKILAVGGVAGLTLKFGLDSLSQPRPVSETRFLMGTIVNLTVVCDDPEDALATVQACLDHMESLEAILSHFKPESQLSHLNHAGQLVDASPHLVGLLEQSKKISELSGGAFDITIKPVVDVYQVNASHGGLPSDEEILVARKLVDYRGVHLTGNQISLEKPGMAITLDGIAKGYIIDQGVDVLRKFGHNDVLVEAGGDLLATGFKNQQEPWKVGLQSPRTEESNLVASFQVHDKAVATSGDYMQPYTEDFSKHHILDPRTGYSAPKLASASVFAPSATLADGIATTLMVMGPSDGQVLIRNLPECEAYLVSKDLQTYMMNS